MIIRDSVIIFGRYLPQAIGDWFYEKEDFGLEQLQDFLLFLERTSKLN